MEIIMVSVKAKNGKTIKDKKEITDRWTEYFEAFLNRPIAQENPKICENEDDPQNHPQLMKCIKPSRK